MNVDASKMTYTEYQEHIQRVQGVILPVGSCEQHGYHLPIGTDNYISQFITEALCQKKGWLLLPPISFGYVWSAQNFPGTFSIKEQSYKLFLKDILVTLEKHGVKNILIFTGHNGNLPILKSICRELKDEFDFNNIYYSGVQIPKNIDEWIDDPIAYAHHADEVETSMMLYIDETLVSLNNARNVNVELTLEQKHRPLYWEEINSVGSFGNVKKSTKEKGKRIIEYNLNYLSALIDQIEKNNL